jgi:hypothetical protein
MLWWVNYILRRLEKRGLFSSGMSGRKKAAPSFGMGAAPERSGFQRILTWQA